MFRDSVAELESKVYAADEIKAKGILEKYFRDLVIFASDARQNIDPNDLISQESPFMEEADSLIKERNKALFHAHLLQLSQNS